VLKLYGFPVSNYFNMVKLALLEKGVPFEVVMTYPSREEEYLAKSPRGKVPCLGTERGFINETDAILDYIEETQGGIPLLPSDPYDRAVTRALMKEVELYIELSARLCIGEVIVGARMPDAIRERSIAELKLGVAALKRHGKFAPYLAGDSFTLADIVFLHTADYAALVAKTVFAFDLLAEVPQAAELLARLKQRPHAITVEADRAEAMDAFLAARRAG